jgi:hypothetical protein
MRRRRAYVDFDGEGRRRATFTLMGRNKDLYGATGTGCQC